MEPESVLKLGWMALGGILGVSGFAVLLAVRRWRGAIAAVPVAKAAFFAQLRSFLVWTLVIGVAVAVALKR